MNRETDEIRERLVRTIKDSNGRVPRDKAVEELAAVYPAESVGHAIQDALEQLQIDELIDYDTSEEGSRLMKSIWYLKALDEREANALREIKPVARALLRLLYTQGTRDHLGEMKLQDARTKLAEAGFPTSETKHLYVEGRVDTFQRIKSGQYEDWLRVIPEYEKTAEYKVQEEETRKKLDEDISIQTYMTEKLEEEDERRRKRAESRKKPMKQSSL